MHTSNVILVELKPPDLSVKRQWYMFQTIREHPRTDVQDTVCLKPTENTAVVAEEEETNEDTGVPSTSQSVQGKVSSKRRKTLSRSKPAGNAPHRGLTENAAVAGNTSRRGKRGRRKQQLLWYLNMVCYLHACFEHFCYVS